MAFIANQNGAGAKKLGERLGELMAHADRLDMLVGYYFFPTVKGSSIVNNREIAQTKMFAIHRILGEDARIFSLEEEPSASALYDKLRKLADILEQLRELRVDGYLEPIRRRAASEAILVTIEKH